MSRILDAFNKNQTALKRYLRRFAGPGLDVEDIAQEAFLRAFAAEPNQEISSPKAFLFRVARNVALNEIAKQSRAATIPLEDFSDSDVSLTSNLLTAEDEIDGRGRLMALAEAIAQLPPQCSKAFLLRNVHGLSYKEIASRLEISESTVEKHLALGLLRCSTHLRAKGYPLPPGRRRSQNDTNSTVSGPTRRKS